MTKRLTWMEQLRGGAILLVVLGHISLAGSTPSWYQTINKLIYSFHMPLFFMMSGLLFGKRSEEIYPLKVIRGKIITLGIPYIFFAGVYVALNSVLQKVVNVNTSVSLSNLLTLLWKPVAHYWFLWTLIFYFIISCVFYNKKWIMIMLIGSSISAFFINSMGNMFEEFPLSYFKYFSYFFCFAFAFYVGQNYNRILRYLQIRHRGRLLGILACIVFSVCSLIVEKSNIFLVPLIKVILLYSGSLGFLYIICCLSKCYTIACILKMLSKYSWYIYLLHSYFTAISRLVFAKTGIHSVVVQVISGLMIACCCPMLIGKFSKRFKVIDAIFYPSQYLY